MEEFEFNLSMCVWHTWDVVLGFHYAYELLSIPLGKENFKSY